MSNMMSVQIALAGKVSKNLHCAEQISKYKQIPPTWSLFVYASDDAVNYNYCY